MNFNRYNIPVLYVEIDDVTREEGVELLEQYFREVIVAKNALDALCKYKQFSSKNNNSIELLITDIKMPFMNGFELIKKLREFDSTLHTIIISDMDIGPYIKEVTSISFFNNYISKPIEAKELYSVIKKALLSIDKRRIEKNQQNLINQYKNALDYSAIVSKTDLKGYITYVNETFCQISGYSKEELLGKKHSILRHPDVDDNVYTDLWKTIKSKNIFKYQNLPNIAKDGTVYYVNITIVPILDIQGNIIEYMSIRFDTTHLQKSLIAERKTKESQAIFLANMSHEIRTPLNAILGFAEILGESTLPKKEADYIDIINSSASSLLITLNEILDMSKIQSGNLKIERREFGLYQELSVIKKLFEAKANEKNIIFSYDLSDDFLKEIFICGDSSKIKQVLNNLLFNAIKFTPIYGTISLNLLIKEKSERKIKIEFSVKDNGIGIEKNRQKDIFNAFVQESQSTTREYGGTGLGLSICKSLITTLGSELKLDSKKNQGSKFYFELEFEYKTIETVKKTIIKKPIKNYNVNVLVAEDVEINRKLISNLLTKKGIEITFANNGHEAVEIFKKDYNKFSLILMDINMPIMDGMEACKHINEFKKINKIENVAIIALTANVILGDKKKFIENGFDDFISKPIDTDRLRKILDKCLNSSTITSFKNKEKKETVLFTENIIVNNSLEMDIPEEFYIELLNDFLLMVDDEIDKLESAFSKRENQKIIDISHKNKGICGNLLLTRLFEIFNILENEKVLEKDFKVFIKEINKNIFSLKKIYNNYIK